MPAATKRKRTAPNGLAAGERLKRDKLAGPELYSQWGWVSRVVEASQITPNDRLAAYGFYDKAGKPICRNKYAGSEERDTKKRKVDLTKLKPVDGEDTDDIIIVSSEDEQSMACGKKRCKDNPQCINYVGQVRLEDEDGALKAFLEASHIGPSPLSNARKSGLPVGLKNLGATCYANAFIQVWFQDLAFRRGVYNCKPSDEETKDPEDSPIFQLQVTFAALQESVQDVFNPAKLVESLHLRVSEQQDAQEFSKLFMSHLATEFEKQVVPSLKTLIADQFEGKQAYGTICNQCRHHSEHEVDFLELEINLENNGKLEDRIQALLESEELTENNKYYCSRCASLQDATRYTKLRRLPPILHFSLLRFVFDTATLTRKKSKQVILFPSVIDMATFVDVDSPDDSHMIQDSSKGQHNQFKDANGQSDMAYELRGVLLHKGPSAYHGHYEAQVFDVATKQFYQFNDEIVTPIPSLQSRKRPLNGDGDTDSNSIPAAAIKKRRTYSKKKVHVDDSGRREIWPSDSRDNISDYISSRDAYMLIYVRRDPSSDAASLDVPEPPRAARDRVAALNKLHNEACASYIEEESRLTDSFKKIRRSKMDVYRQWEIYDLEEESAVVGRSALEEWLLKGIRGPEKSERGGSPAEGCISNPSQKAQASRSGSPSGFLDSLGSSHILHSRCIDNSAIVCRHGALDPNKARDMKRIKKASFALIRDATGCVFEPELTTADVCKSCVDEMFLEKRYAIDHTIQVARFDELCVAESRTQGTWVSKMWIKDWRQTRPRMHTAGKDDPPPDASEYAAHVVCPHGRLSLVSSLRKRINGEASAFLQSLFPTWSPVLDDAQACGTCDEDLHHTKETKQEVKKRIEYEKTRLPNLMSSSLLGLEPEIIPGLVQAIVPTDFLRQWWSWVHHPHEKSRPGPVDNTQFLCKHDLLIIDPNVTNDLSIAISLVPLSDWETLHELYGGGPLITLTGVVQDGQVASLIVPVTHEIKVCHECRNDRLSNFDTATITVQILSENEPIPVPGGHGKPNNDDAFSDASKAQEASEVSRSDPNRGRVPERPLRTSNRLKKARCKAGRKEITIQKMSTVKDIKVELHDALDIPTICQRLFFHGVELTDNTATSASLGILANDTLYLREEKEDNDALNSDAEPESGSQPRDEGRAFGGTVLGGFKTAPTSGEASDHESSPDILPSSNPCPACTFINPDGSSICEMCGAGLNDR